MPLSRAMRSKIRQTRLNFSPVLSSSPSKEQYSVAVQDRLANVRHDGASSKPHALKTTPDVKIEHLPTPEPSSQLQPHRHSTIEVDQSYAVNGTDALGSPSAIPSTLPQSPTLQSLKVRQSESEEDDEITLPSPKRRRVQQSEHVSPSDATRKRRSTRLQDHSSGGTRISIRRQYSSNSTGRSSPIRNISALGSPETSGNDDDQGIITRPTPRRKNASKFAEDPFVVSDDEVEYLSPDNDPPVTPNRRRNKPRRDDFVVDDDIVELISSEDGLTKPAKPRGPSSRKRRRLARKEQAELESDLENLQDSDTPQQKSRTRGGPVTTQKDKARQHFELLRRRRAGERVPRVVDSSEEQESEGVDMDFIGQPADIYDESEQASAHSSVNTEDEADLQELEEDDFVEDDTPSHSRLPHPDIPLEFTSYATAKPRELFPHVIEWLIKNKIAPAFSRHDPLYKLAFNRINDQVTAQAGSRLISSAWNADFKYAVLARPDMTTTWLGFDEDNFLTCDACNRTNHPATYEFVFSGQAYAKDSLEPIEPDSGSDSSNNHNAHEETASRDGAGHLLPSQTTRFHLGRFCAANAEMGHKLTHWKHRLNQSLLTYLEEQGVLSAAAVMAREKSSQKKREKEAERIVDNMGEMGMIAEMWKDFKNDLDDARVGMEGYERKGGRSKGRVGTVERAAAYVW